TASRVWCSFCGNTDSQGLRRLEPESGDEGYFISACTKCRGYLKELDRRVRWNGGPALVEDWGSPHLDLVARRSGYCELCRPSSTSGKRKAHSGSPAVTHRECGKIP